jgi:hypothetical protein
MDFPIGSAEQFCKAIMEKQNEITIVHMRLFGSEKR